MIIQRCFVIALSLMLVSSAMAQTVRFDTNVGTFDMLLNPTENLNLQGHVDNLLAYVESGRYDGMLINRAVDGFALQMGGFISPHFTPQANQADYITIPRFDPVIVDTTGDNDIDFDTPGLSNTRGTVTLALSPTAAGPDMNSGTSSFFVNLVDNSGSLDPGATNDNGQVTGGFVPFAEILNMETIDLILNLNNVNLFGINPAVDPTFTNVPLLDGGIQIFVERAFVLTSTAQAGGESQSAVPEPSALLLAVLAGLCAAYGSKPSRKRPLAA